MCVAWRRSRAQVVTGYLTGAVEAHTVAGPHDLRLPPSLNDIHRSGVLEALVSQLWVGDGTAPSLPPPQQQPSAAARHARASGPPAPLPSDGVAGGAGPAVVPWARCPRALLSTLRLLRTLAARQPRAVTALLNHCRGWVVLTRLLDTAGVRAAWEGDRDVAALSAPARRRRWGAVEAPCVAAAQLHVLALVRGGLLAGGPPGGPHTAAALVPGLPSPHGAWGVGGSPTSPAPAAGPQVGAVLFGDAPPPVSPPGWKAVGDSGRGSGAGSPGPDAGGGDATGPGPTHAHAAAAAQAALLAAGNDLLGHTLQLVVVATVAGAQGGRDGGNDGGDDGARLGLEPGSVPCLLVQEACDLLASLPPPAGGGQAHV